MAQDPNRQQSIDPTRMPIPQRSMGRTFEAFRYRDFRFLFIAHMSNASAQWMQMIGLPILVYAVTGSAAQVGLVMVARTIPALILGIFSGVVADTFNRRTVLILTRLAGTVLALWFAATMVIGSVAIAEIYVFAVLRGATMAFDQAPRRAVIPSMVPSHTVVNALSLTNGGQHVMRMAAASTAGTLIAIWGIEAAFVALAVLYMIGIPFLILMRVQDHEREGYKGLRRMFRDAWVGLRFAAGTPAMRGALIVGAVFFIFGMSFSNVFVPVLAEESLGLPEGALGWLIAVMGAGGTTGTLAIAYLSPSHHRGLVLTSGLTVFGLLLAAMAGSTYVPTAIAAFVVIFFVGNGQSIFMPLLSTIVLQSAPDNMRGRAMSMLSWDRALVSGGSAVAGFTIEAWGPQIALLTFAGACVIAGVALTSTGALRRVD